MNTSMPLRRPFAMLLLATLLSTLSPALAQPAPQEARCFAATGECISGRFAEYWDKQGGLPVFGMAITPAGYETRADSGQSLYTQWLERNRFELHPDQAAPYDVELGRLGAELLQAQQIDWQTLPKADPSAPHYFPATRHAIAYAPFWQYWRSNGLELGDPGISDRESLALFGMPISEPTLETNASGDTVLTQWFERARFEDHGAKGVLLGLLGTELRAAQPDLPVVEANPVRFAWFYKPPTDGTPLSTLTRYADDYILTHYDEPYRDDLIEAGVAPERILQYIIANEIQDPKSCTARPWGNQYAFKPGDFCRISTEHPDWFLLDVQGRRICRNNLSETYCLMDPGHSGWRAFALERTRELRGKFGWQGVFLDNIDGSLARANGATRQYQTNEELQNAMIGYLRYLRDNFYAPENVPVLANLTERRDEQVWYRYLEYLNGAMEEGCLVDWQTGYRSADEWEAQVAKLERTQALGKRIICVAQGSRRANDHQRFAFASYLLAANGLATFRYTDNEAYSEFWPFATYDLDLGQPLGPRYKDGAGWRRDFARGSVFVDPLQRTAAITPR